MLVEINSGTEGSAGADAKHLSLPISTSSDPSTLGSLALFTLCSTEKSYSTPEVVERVRRLVMEEKADVCYCEPPGRPNCCLQHFIARGAIECFEWCMQTESPIDFTQLGSSGSSPLHLICSCDPPETAARLLAAIVERLELHPTDRVDWRQANRSGYDFLSRAAMAQRLHQFWPLLQNVPTFADAVEPIRIQSGVMYASDWEKLTEEDRKCFDTADMFWE